MQWYYSKNATQLGPVSQDELRAKLASGEVSGTDMVWREGMPDWRPASTVTELAGAEVSPTSLTPANSPYQAPGVPTNPSLAEIPNYLWQSIVVTILCCWPLGIPAIVYAAKVDSLKATGNIQGALAASNSAKTWCWVALGSWAVLIVIYLLFAVLMLAVGGSQQFQ